MRASVFLSLLALGLSFNDTVYGDPADADGYERNIVPFLRMYCVDCHAGEEAEAELRFDLSESPDLFGQFDQWTVVLQRVGGHEMPPEDTLQPSDAEREAFASWLEAGLSNFDCTKQKAAPRTTARRLNRFEYNNVIQDLFGLPLSPADEFPADNVGEGFDNISEVLSLPPLLMEKYLDAAELVVAALAERDSHWDQIFPSTAGGVIDNRQIENDISQLAARAFRRPLEADERSRLMTLYKLARGQGASTREALQLVTQAILISPNFLFRLEEDPLAAPGEPIGSFSIASRLSFFLWGTIPDGELNRLAAQDQLQDAKAIAEQARRMVQNPRISAFVDSFTGQWLELRLLASAAPDPEQFPDFDEALRDSMVQETAEYFRQLLVNNGSILDLLDSDYTYLNQRLAEHYGVGGVHGDGLRQVRLLDDRRGGILTHGSILTLTSNPTRTSPVKRGKWILENILGTPPPPPPPNVPELAEGEDLLGSLRERMQQHRENPSCAVCHRKMDALGFGFENFDATGAWRDADGRYTIDAAGVLPGDIRFEKPAELRQILRSNSREFTTCLTRKLLTYALGRALTARDQCEVDVIVEQVEKNEHRFTDLVVAVVTSDLFRLNGDAGTGATK
jgi:hypothetical protein